MRLSTAYSYESSVYELQRRQEEMSTAQQQMTSGKRVERPGDDPTAAAQIERALVEESRGRQLQRSVDASRNVMTLTEAALGDAVDLSQRAREALVAAGNGSYNATERQALATTLKEIRNQLLGVANQKDGAGNLLFGRQGNTSGPYVDNGSGVTTTASGGALAGSGSENLPLSIDGPAVWLQVPSGNGVFETGAGAGNTGTGWVTAGQVTDPSAWSALSSHGYTVSFANDPTSGKLTYSVTDDATGSALADASGNTAILYQPGKSITLVPGIEFSVSGTPAAGNDSFHIGDSDTSLNVFKALDKAVAALSSPTANAGQVMQAVNAGMSDLDQVLSTFQASRSQVGETLNRLDGIESRTSGRILSAQTTRSDVEDVDMVQAISEFTNRQTSYQAALQSYSIVQKMSLFNYISG